MPENHVAYPTQTTCPTKLENDGVASKIVPWTDQEKWVWNRNICLGKVADLSTLPEGQSKDCNTNNAKHWPEDRILSQNFIETVLFHEPYKSSYAKHGFRIKCAKFDEEININQGVFDKEIWMDYSYFEKGLTAIEFKTTKSITFDESRFDAPIDADGIEIGGGLYMRGGTKLHTAKFGDARIRRSFNLSESQFTQDFILSGARIEGAFVAQNVKSFQKTRFINTEISGNFSVSGSKFKNDFIADGMKVGGNMYIRDGTEFTTVRLLGVKIGRNLDASKSSFSGDLIADGIVVESNVNFSGNSKLNNARFQGAKVGGNFNAIGAQFSGALLAQGIEVGKNVFLKNKATFKNIDLQGAQIDGNLEANASRFEDNFNISDIKISGNVYFRTGSIFQNISLMGSSIGGNLDLRGSHFTGEVDLTGTHVAGDLIMGDDELISSWSKEAKLLLRNTSVGALQDTQLAWENLDGKLDLTGFQYDQLSGAESSASTPIGDRPVKWLLGWIGKQQNHNEGYHPQPYQQLAKALRTHGYPDISDDIMIAANNHYLGASTTPWTKKILLTIEWAAFGYGYRSWLSLVWIFLLIGTGMYASSQSKGVLSRASFDQRFWYSTDQLIPVLTLNEKHKNIGITGWPRVYFYIHPILGFIFVSFFIAGVTGFAK